MKTIDELMQLAAKQHKIRRCYGIYKKNKGFNRKGYQ